VDGRKKDTTMANLLIYGAYGYTGELVVAEAVAKGLQPIVAGRREAPLRTLAETHKLQWRVADLTPEALDAALVGVSVVLNCAGPFSRTAKPMIEACLRNKANYLDITGEIAVFELAARLTKKALAAGVTVMPGVGFDVVPSDCLAAHLKTRLPSATHLTLGFQSTGRTSHGTATTLVENIDQGGAVRIDGKIVQVPAAHKSRVIDFGLGPTGAVTIPWGDVSTAFYSTAIPNIEVFIALPASAQWGMRLSRFLKPILATAWVKKRLQAKVDSGPPGPTPKQRERSRSYLWGEVRDAAGKTCTSRLQAPDGYTLTAQAGVAIAQAALAGSLPPGFQTPAMALGADFVLSLPGVSREDLL
jgi:short subunit dehydrogenase-like uncharacterized protein